MKKTQLVFVPAPGFGHLVAAVQLAKMVLERNDSFLITMLAIHNPIYGGTSKNTESLASIHTEIRFIEIPETIPAPPPEALAIEKTRASLSLGLLTLTISSPVIQIPCLTVFCRYCTSMWNMRLLQTMEEKAESLAVSALLARDDIPPIFNVGPLIDHKGKSLSGSDAVKRDEILKWLDELRNKAKETSEMAKKAVVEGGSSYVAFGNLIDQWLGGKP
nr:UDP-glycosyltransferase 71K2-like [Populus alba]